MMHGKVISDNEIYLLIKYIKSVLWRLAKRLSYIEEARCLKVNHLRLLSISCFKVVHAVLFFWISVLILWHQLNAQYQICMNR